MIVKSFSNSRHNSRVGNLEWKEEPGSVVCEMFLVKEKEPEDVVDDLDPTEDGEPSDRAHCAFN